MKSYFDSDFYEEIKLEDVKTFFTTLLILPFILLGKSLRTFFNILAALIALAVLIPTFGRLTSRSYFIERATLLGKDLGDWVVFPFAVSRFLLRCLFSVRNQRV